VNEQGESGSNSHVEGVAEFETVNTSNVTQRVKGLYKTLKIDVSPNSIRVKKVTHLIGAIIYANKEIETDGVVLILKGWTQTWIDKQVKDNVKNIPHKMLKKKGTRLTQGTAGALIYEWAIANTCRVVSKQDYQYVAKQMAKEGYLFGSVRHVGVFQDVCALFGSGDAVESAIEQALHWL